MALLQIENLSAFYGKAQALHDVGMEVEAGEIIAVVGANGAGKSTLLDSIVRLTSTTGSIIFDGVDLKTVTTSKVVQSGVGYAPERFNLFPYMSVFDNLMVGAFTARGDIKKNLDAVYQLFPKLRERASQETHTQSGGERQMVSLGRALMTSPRLLLIDEPTIGLAPKVCDEIAVALRRMQSEFGVTIVITEQNANFAMSLAERVYVMETGRIKLHGTVAELENDPQLGEAYFGHS